MAKVVKLSSSVKRKVKSQVCETSIFILNFNWNPPGEYILQAGEESSGNELDNLLLEEALQLVGINDLNVSIGGKPCGVQFSSLIRVLTWSLFLYIRITKKIKIN